MSASSKAIFLSYASQDADAARRICDALRAVGLDVWFDQSALRGGDAWDASIRRQIKECTLFVPVISANTQAREEGYFRREWNLAANRTLDMSEDKAFLLPVVIDATMDAKARVPEKFREVQWTHLPGGEAAAAFAERVQRLLMGGAERPQPVAPRVAVPATVPTSAPTVANPANEPPSIAVLPFVNMSRDEENEYFADGLSEELLNVLAKIRGLRVASRTSAFSFKGSSVDIPTIGKKLNVATVLEGSVRRAGKRLRISAQLVQVATDSALWSQTYDRELDDIFAVQDDIAQAVVKELRVALLGTTSDGSLSAQVKADVAAATKGRGADADAYQLFLQGRFFADRQSEEGIAKGIEFYNRALAIDAGYALAWAFLARAYADQAGYAWAPYSETFERARQAAERSIELEPNLAEGHAALGFIRMARDWNWQAAHASLRRALELAPGNVHVLRDVAIMAACLGRQDEAIVLLRRAVTLDPLSSRAHRVLGSRYLSAGLLDEAEATLAKALELNPGGGFTHYWLGMIELARKQWSQARSTFEQESVAVLRLLGLTLAEHSLGNAAGAEATLRELVDKHASGAASQIALAYAYIGDADRAFAWLARADAERDPGLIEIKAELLLRNLHGDARWQALLQKMGLAEAAATAAPA